MNVQEAGKLLVYLKSFYPHAVVDAMAPVTWADLFANLPAEEVMAAAKDAVKESEFFPTVALLVEIIRDNKQRQPTPYVRLEGEKPKGIAS